MKIIFKNFRKLGLILFVALFLPFSGKAQQSQFELSWQKGLVILNSGDTIQGPLTLTALNDIVRIAQPDGSVGTFSAVNVKSFVVEGEQENRFFRRNRSDQPEPRREYRSFMWNHDKDYSNFKSPAFFMVLQSGTRTLLMREQIERRLDNFSQYSNAGSRQTIEVRVEKYYLLTPDERIIPLRNPKNDLLSAYPNNEKEIMSYAKSNKLDFTDSLELSRIVSYANSLP
jgi:hypothetical protein